MVRRPLPLLVRRLLPLLARRLLPLLARRLLSHLAILGVFLATPQAPRRLHHRGSPPLMLAQVRRLPQVRTLPTALRRVCRAPPWPERLPTSLGSPSFAPRLLSSSRGASASGRCSAAPRWRPSSCRPVPGECIEHPSLPSRSAAEAPLVCFEPSPVLPAFHQAWPPATSSFPPPSPASVSVQTPRDRRSVSCRSECLAAAAVTSKHC
mmetsp:Transcript_9687/g.21271  ORF Transcript_9687/g.21271 Transcript_9687/m.21271 type:complete len:208 (+) Transcript_9687:23-646(+)